MTVSLEVVKVSINREKASRTVGFENVETGMATEEKYVVFGLY
jgi:hypothetical protein